MSPHNDGTPPSASLHHVFGCPVQTAPPPPASPQRRRSSSLGEAGVIETLPRPVTPAGPSAFVSARAARRRLPPPLSPRVRKPSARRAQRRTRSSWAIPSFQARAAGWTCPTPTQMRCSTRSNGCASSMKASRSTRARLLWREHDDSPRVASATRQTASITPHIPRYHAMPCALMSTHAFIAALRLTLSLHAPSSAEKSNGLLRPFSRDQWNRMHG